MIKIIAIVIVGAIAAVLIFAATKPNSFRVERSIDINASPEKIFALIDDLHGWPAWSPYETKDPGMKHTVSGAASGKGAVYEWEGNKNVGKGRMEILESRLNSKVVIQLDFLEPFKARNTAEFTLVPRGNATKVGWALYGPSPYLSKLMGVFVNMDTMIGKDFEDGLASLKTLAEK